MNIITNAATSDLISLLLISLGTILIIFAVIQIVKQLVSNEVSRLSGSSAVFSFVLGGAMLLAGMWNRIQYEAVDTSATNTVAENSAEHDTFAPAHALVNEDVSSMVIICIIMLVIILVGIGYAVYRRLKKDDTKEKIDE